MAFTPGKLKCLRFETVSSKLLYLHGANSKPSSRKRLSLITPCAVTKLLLQPTICTTNLRTRALRGLRFDRILAVTDSGFLRGDANHGGGDANKLFDQLFIQNCMKMKKFWPRWGMASLASFVPKLKILPTAINFYVLW